jgi:hypothetical protein
MCDWLTGRIGDDWSPEILPDEAVVDERGEHEEAPTDEDERGDQVQRPPLA